MSGVVHIDRSKPMTPPTTVLRLFAAALVLGVLGASTALADEITYRDAETCEEITVKPFEITSETWTEIKYKEAERGPEKSVPTALVVSLRRKGGGTQAQDLINAMGELSRGNLGEAQRRLKVLSGGGMKQDLETGKMVYVPFTKNDPPGRRKRPTWESEYAHFFYAKTLYEAGVAKQDADLLGEAYLALVDQKVPGGDGKEKTGGFLARFQGGNSRWYPEAMLLAAQTLVHLKKYDDAAKMFKQLGDEAIAADIGPRWAYEAKLGSGMIAEAQGKYLDAVNAYTDAATSMRLMLRNEVRNCFRRELGRLHSRARMQAASVMLGQAEKNKSPAEFRRLREFILECTPEALQNKYRALAAAQREALVDGARDPRVQAVMQNGLGLAYLQEGKFEEAILAFRAVEVRYFQVPEEHARALHYLSQAADRAAQAATGDAKALYESYRDSAQARLKAEHPKSAWLR